MGNDISSRLDNARKTGSLQFSELKLTKMPDDIRKLNTLRGLDLSINKITIIEPWIDVLSNLRLINFNGNKLAYLPVNITRLAKLESLLVANNQLISLTPPSTLANFSALSNLRTVDLSGNRINEFPVELCSKSIPLDHINLSRNEIEIVPSCIELIQAIELNLNENRITVVAESIARCPRLKVLRLAHNRIKLEDFPLLLLESSNVSLLAVEGNPMQMKALQELPEYAKYMERFTATKRKAIP